LSIDAFLIAGQGQAIAALIPAKTASRRTTITMAPSKYLLVSLPTSISSSGDKDEALTTLRSSVSTNNGTTYPFAIPEFKIGTLDALVQQADDLTKLSNSCQAVVGKVGDSLRSILDGDEDKIEQQKTINDSRPHLLHFTSEP
jgi:hypothetical protein